VTITINDEYAFGVSHYEDSEVVEEEGGWLKRKFYNQIGYKIKI
jgi:hypothetical protein